MGKGKGTIYITHLCIGLFCLLWALGYPFMGGYFNIQSDLILIESVMGKQDILAKLDPERVERENGKRERNSRRYSQLPEEERQFVQTLYDARSFVSLSQKWAMLKKFPLLEWGWIILSILIPILLLRGKGRQWVWLLPLVTVGYAVNNQMKGHDDIESALYPKELELGVPLEEAWKNYLKVNWSKEGSVEDGEFYFNLARLKHLTPSLSSPFWEKKSVVLLGLYIFWNFYFAILCSKRIDFGTKDAV